MSIGPRHGIDQAAMDAMEAAYKDVSYCPRLTAWLMPTIQDHFVSHRTTIVTSLSCSAAYS